MVICVESGISLEAAFTRVSEEMAVDAPALSEEIAITTAELAFLSDRRQALDNLAERTGSQPIKSLVTSLIQSEKYGTPLGAALRVVSQEGRDTRMAQGRGKGRGAAGEAHRADGDVLPAGAVHGADRPDHHPGDARRSRTAA